MISSCNKFAVHNVHHYWEKHNHSHQTYSSLLTYSPGWEANFWWRLYLMMRWAELDLFNYLLLIFIYLRVELCVFGLKPSCFLSKLNWTKLVLGWIWPLACCWAYCSRTEPMNCVVLLSKPSWITWRCQAELNRAELVLTCVWVGQKCPPWACTNMASLPPLITHLRISIVGRGSLTGHALINVYQ